jgi:hypothetical protein
VRSSPQAFVKAPSPAKGVPARFASGGPAAAAKAESCEGCPCPLCLRRTSGCSEGLERRVASLPSLQQLPSLLDRCLLLLIYEEDAELMDLDDLYFSRSANIGVFICL